MVKRIVDQDGFVLKPFEEKLGVRKLQSLERKNKAMALKSERLSEIACLLSNACRIESIIETGTFKGNGTTTSYAFTKADVYSCELNKAHYDAAMVSIGYLPHVHIDHAYSVNKNQIPQDLINRIGVEKTPNYDNWLIETLHSNKNKRVMASLDSDGRNGGKELEIVMAAIDLYDNIRCIILDDLTTIKHSGTPEILEKEYGLDVYQVENRWGFVIVPSAKWG